MEKRGTTVCYTLQDPGGKQARRPNIPQTLPKNLAMHSYKFSLLKAAFPLLKEIEVFIQYSFLSLSLSDCMTSLNMSPCKTKNCTPTNMSKLNRHPRANVKFSTLPKPYTHRACSSWTKVSQKCVKFNASCTRKVLDSLHHSQIACQHKIRLKQPFETSVCTKASLLAWFT